MHDTQDQTSHDPRRKLGFWMSTALVVGNTIGIGIFLLPAALAASAAELRLVLAPDEGAATLAALLATAKPASLALLVGPEGGLDEAEIGAARLVRVDAGEERGRRARVIARSIAQRAAVGLREPAEDDHVFAIGLERFQRGAELEIGAHRLRRPQVLARALLGAADDPVRRVDVPEPHRLHRLARLPRRPCHSA